ncbi:MAG: PorP/SprF family type IX secretion system membrane protein [Bacteroidetes bacterium]|nr:PorP/SprF family type IX secretion system membrane protein [Bacteroidota bacterium]
MNIKYCKKYLLILLVLLIPFSLIGQDIHFSQFLNSPLNVNPAQTGFFHGSHRFILNHRNQWASVTRPYSTFSGSFDMQLLKRKFKRDIIGIGVVFSSDKAGDAAMGTTQGSLSLSYTKGLNRRNSHFISFGLQGCAAQHRFDYSQLNFDNQYNGDFYDASLYTGENFRKDSYFYLDVSTGMHWFLQIQDQLIFNAGLSAFHINQPSLSFFDNSKAKLNTRFTFYANSEIGLNVNTDILPSFLIMKQATYTELCIGADIRFINNNSPYFYSAIVVGAFLRNKDAFILKAGLDQRKWSFGLSYDFNFSDLTPASKYLGGYEISIIYIVNRTGKRKVKEIPCPIF